MLSLPHSLWGSSENRFGYLSGDGSVRSLQTKLQTNHSTQAGIGQHKPGSSHEKCQTRSHGWLLSDARQHENLELEKCPQHPSSTVTEPDCFSTAGGFHEPSRIDGGVSLGQYMRNIRMNLPVGAGSQFDSLFAPGDAFWM